MSAIVGERDRALRSTIPRNINPTAGKDFRLDVDPAAFHVAADGTITPAVATFTATMVGFTATVLWSVTGGATLTASSPNVRTLAAANMPGTTVKVTATTVYDGQAYIATRSIFKLSDGKPGTDAPPVDMSPAAILAALEGRITDSQLYADLRSRISLITDPVSVPGSVQAQVKAETDARVVAIGAATLKSQQDLDKEIGDRIAAVLAEAGARTTYVQTYTFSKQEMNSALSIQATQIAAGYTGYTDLKTGQALATAAADVRSYTMAKSDINGAISAAETRLRAEFVSGNGATEAYVQSWSFSKADSLAAESAQTNTLTANYQGYADQKKSEAIAVAAADVRSYTTAKSDQASAEIAQTNALTVAYTAYADAARTAAISAARAEMIGYGYSFANADGAIAAAENRLRAEFVSSGGATEAYVQGWSYSKADTNYAETLQTNQLTANYKAYTDTAAGLAVTNANAFTQQYAYAKTDAVGAFASLSTQITAAYQGYANNAAAQAVATSNADVRSYSVAKTELAGAIAQATSSLSTTVGQNTATIQNQSTSIGGLSTQQVFKSDINGYVTGIGLASSAAGATPTSEIILMADVFGFVLPGFAPKKLLTLGQVSGQSAMVLHGDFTADGDITARMLKITTSGGALNRDPNFGDLAGSWELSGSMQAGTNPGGPNVPANTYVFAPGGAAGFALAKEIIPIDATKTYLLAGSTYAEAGNNKLCAYIVNFYDNNNAVIASTGWGDANYSGLVNVFTPTEGWHPYRVGSFGANAGGRTIPPGSRTCRIGVLLNAGGSTAQLMAATALRLEEMVSSVRLEDGAVTAEKLKVGRVGNTGAGVELDKNGERVYDDNNMKRYQSGRLDV